jgi:amino acid permease
VKNDAIVSTPTKKIDSTVLNCASIIAGTTIGGGFLALPYATAPSGALPSSIALVGCWLYLLANAFALADANLYVIQELSDQKSESTDGSVTGNSISGPVSVFTLAKAAFGRPGGAVAGLLFFSLMLSTLIAQLSKIGTLFGGSYLGRSGGILLWVCLMAGVSFSRGQLFAEKVNTALTALMMASFAALVAAARGAGWTSAGLQRADFSRLVPRPGQGYASWAVPIFLQLLVYAETIPLVCFRLKDKAKIRHAIFLGSFVPLLMCIVWTLTALGLVPVTAASAATGTMIDPVQVLINSASTATTFSFSHVVTYSVKSLALSAVATTVIGSFLVMSQFFEDVLYSSGPKRKWTSSNAPIARALAVIPGTLVAIFGSPSLYYAATAFAGAFPVTLLWGLFPPLAVLKLRQNRKLDKKTVFNVVLSLLGFALLSVNLCLGGIMG